MFSRTKKPARVQKTLAGLKHFAPDEEAERCYATGNRDTEIKWAGGCRSAAGRAARSGCRDGRSWQRDGC